jgi:glycerol-3-phosphate dehydrogenase
VKLLIFNRVNTSPSKKQSDTTTHKANPTHFDLIIIGGGINGAGIARDSAMRGLKVLLVDKDDFAYGTSSRSTKLIHGGIRYLENYDFKLVWEACHERKILTKIAPQLVHMLGFVIPVYKGDKRPAWLVKLGMLLYDLMAGFQNLKWHKNLSKKGVLKLIPNLKKEGLKGGGIYYDAQTNDARLVLANIQDAAKHGATVKNYTEVATIKAHFSIDGKNGKPREERADGVEVVCQDVLTAEKTTYIAPIIVNATGPWLDQNLKKWHVEEEQDEASQPGKENQHGSNSPKSFLKSPYSNLRLTKGIHFFIPKITNEQALLIGAQYDGRVFFVIPWGEYSLVGTTDTDYQKNPDEVKANDGDRDYLLTELNRLFPEKKLKLSDIVADYAGLRPLLHVEGVKEGAVTREYKLKTDQIGYNGTLISVVGGKITTYRRLAQKVTDLVAQKRASKCHTADQKLPGSNFHEQNFAEFKKHKLAQKSQLQALDPDIADNLLNTYGSQIDQFLPYLEEHFGQHPAKTNKSVPGHRSTDKTESKSQHVPTQLDPASRIISQSPVIWAQLFYGIDHEFVRTAEDFIRRRTELYIHQKKHPEMEEMIGKEMKI